MWNTNQDQQQGGGGGGYGDQGGGYLNSPGNFGSPSSSQGPAGKSRSRVQNVLPCTTAQVLMSQQRDDKFFLDEIELHQVSLVGIVRTVEENPTRINYNIDDMSGQPLEVRQFVDNDENSPEDLRTEVAMENQYVRVYGNVRDFQGKRSINAFKVLKVEDHNEITSHLLETIHAHLALTKAQSGSVNGNAQPAVGYSGAGDTTVGGGGSSFSGGQVDSGLNPTQNQVHKLISSCPDDQGLSIQTITEKIRGIPQKAIRDAIEFLSGEGHIYSTIDDEHYKSTDSA